ncbi:hypothetical protein Fmac_012069 [Flemingia macrophylla]|uniref:Uncharacterized protein n=1 Tax=Flemingia macrophylla TaxID=520843 RepID=A0ABD1MQ32_9FABA
MQTLGGLLVSPVLKFIMKFMRFPPIGPCLSLIQLPWPSFNFLLCLCVLRVAKNGAIDSSSNSEDQVFDIMSLKILALLRSGDKQASGKEPPF